MQGLSDHRRPVGRLLALTAFVVRPLSVSVGSVLPTAWAGKVGEGGACAATPLSVAQMPEYLFLVSVEALPVKRRCGFSSEPELAAFLIELEKTLQCHSDATHAYNLSEYFVQVWDTDFEDFVVLESFDQIGPKGKIHLRLRATPPAPEACNPDATAGGAPTADAPTALSLLGTPAPVSPQLQGAVPTAAVQPTIRFLDDDLDTLAPPRPQEAGPLCPQVTDGAPTVHAAPIPIHMPETAPETTPTTDPTLELPIIAAVNADAGLPPRPLGV